MDLEPVKDAMNLNNTNEVGPSLPKDRNVELKHGESQRRKRFHFIKPFRKSRHGKNDASNFTRKTRTSEKLNKSSLLNNGIGGMALLPDKPIIKGTQSMQDIRKTNEENSRERNAFAVHRIQVWATLVFT